MTEMKMEIEDIVYLEYKDEEGKWQFVPLKREGFPEGVAFFVSEELYGTPLYCNAYSIEHEDLSGFSKPIRELKEKLIAEGAPKKELQTYEISHFDDDIRQTAGWLDLPCDIDLVPIRDENGDISLEVIPIPGDKEMVSFFDLLYNEEVELAQLFTDIVREFSQQNPGFCGGKDLSEVPVRAVYWFLDVDLGEDGCFHYNGR